MLLTATATISANLRSGVESDFGYSLTATWETAPLSPGIEMFGGLGDPQVFVEPPCRNRYLGPAVSFSFAPGWVARAQSAAGTAGHLLRLQVAYAF